MCIKYWVYALYFIGSLSIWGSIFLYLSSVGVRCSDSISNIRLKHYLFNFIKKKFIWRAPCERKAFKRTSASLWYPKRWMCGKIMDYVLAQLASSLWLNWIMFKHQCHEFSSPTKSFKNTPHLLRSKACSRDRQCNLRWCCRPPIDFNNKDILFLYVIRGLF